MKHGKSSSRHRPFKNLHSLLASRIHTKAHKLETLPDDRDPVPEKGQTPDLPEIPAQEEEATLFLKTVADITPISSTCSPPSPPSPCKPPVGNTSPEQDARRDIEILVDKGQGFVVANTPEYIEGTGYNVHPDMAKR